MPRIYRVTFEEANITGVQDLVFIPGSGTGKLVKILRRWVSATDTALPTAQMLGLRERFLPATVTVGSGGTTGITPSKNDPGDATCGITTAATNNTSKATTSGTAVVLSENGAHSYNGYDDIVLNPYPIANGEAYVFEVIGILSGTLHLSGGVEFSEEGG